MCLLPGGARLSRYSRPWHTAPLGGPASEPCSLTLRATLRRWCWILRVLPPKNTLLAVSPPGGEWGSSVGRPPPLVPDCFGLVYLFLGTRTSAESELNLSFWDTGSSTQSVLSAKGTGWCLGYLDTSLPMRASFPAGGTRHPAFGGAVVVVVAAAFVCC